MLSSSLGQLSIHIPVTAQLLIFVAALLIAAWGVFTLVIRYHWKNYSTRKSEIFVMSFFYLSGSLVLIGLMGTFLFLYSLSD